ncbi:MAG: CDP-alcohol phosphatidyltransferase family protein [Variovorax sp.]
MLLWVMMPTDLKAMLSSHASRRPGDNAGLTALRHDAARTVAAIGLLLACAALAAAQAWLGDWYAVKALAVFGLGCALAWRALPAHRPHACFGSANAVTLLRLALIAMLAASIGEAAGSLPAGAWAMVGVATVAALLDAVDGPLARRSGSASAFGARFDMETDALLILVLCVLAVQMGKVGPWILLAGLLRYGFVAAAAPWPWLAHPLPPRMLRKVICVVQTVTLIVCLAPWVDASAARWIAGAGLAALLYSFISDIRWLARHRHP